MTRLGLIFLVVFCWLDTSIHDSPQNERPRDFVPSYILGPNNDQIVVRRTNLEVGEKPVALGIDGYNSLPLLGRIKVPGLTVEQLETKLRKELEKYVRGPQLSVTVAEFRSHPVSGPPIAGFKTFPPEQLS